MVGVHASSRRRLLAGSAALGATAWLGAGSGRARAEDERVLEEVRSAFNHIVVAQHGTVRTMYFVGDGVRYIESRLDLAHPRSLDLDYTRTMMAGFLVRPDPKRLLMIGLGGGQISNYLFDRIPGLEIDAVDIDPEVLRVARTYFGVPDDPRYRLHAGDGRLFVERSRATWDMIVLDAFRGVFVPLHLKTAEFFAAVRARLGPDGVVVANLHNVADTYAADQQTLASVFARRYNFHSESGNQTTFVGGAGGRPVGFYRMHQHARRLAGAFDFDLPGLVARHFLVPDWDRTAAIRHDDFAPAERDRAVDRHNRKCPEDCPYPAR